MSKPRVHHWVGRSGTTTGEREVDRAAARSQPPLHRSRKSASSAIKTSIHRNL